MVLSVKDDGAFQRIFNLKCNVQIEVKMRPSDVMLTRMKWKQAQLGVIDASPRLIKDI